MCTARRDLRLVPLDLDYDHLVLALGSETNFFGMQGVAENAVTLKTLGDAALLRARVLAILEMASLEPDASVRKRMLTFLVAGGGFAGVETIGAINDLVHDALRYYPHLAPQDVRVVLIHPGEFVLPELGEKLGRYAQQKLAERGVEISPEDESNRLRQLARRSLIRRSGARDHAHLDRRSDAQPSDSAAAVQVREGASRG